MRVKAVKLPGYYVLRYTDAIGKTYQRKTDIPAKESLRYVARRRAIEWEQQLQSEAEGVVPWPEFDRRYSLEVLSGLGRSNWSTVCHAIEAVIAPVMLADLTSSSISRLAAHWRNLGRAEATIRSYLATLHAALTWAEDVGMLHAVPKFPRQKRAKKRPARSRPVLGEEYDRLLDACVLVRDQDAEQWRQLLECLWLSGLRLSEALSLSWDSGDFQIDLAGRYPVYRIRGEGQKSGQDQTLPIAPEFAAWLDRLPRRRGRVLDLSLALSTAKRIVAAIGRRAGVRVNDKGKTATAHDLRRSFGTRWASRVTPAELMSLMRHSSIETTMRYYVDLDAQELAQKLWSHVDGPVKDRDRKNQAGRDRSEERSVR